MASQHPFTFELAEEMHHFDFFDPLNNPAANLLSYWPPIAPAPPLRLASDIDSIDSVFAQHNPVAFSTANAATSNMEYPFTFELNDIVDQDSETGSDETVYIDPRVVFESTPPSPTIAIDDIEQEDSNDEHASAVAGNPTTEPRVIAPLPPRRSSRSKRLASASIPSPVITTSEPMKTRKVSLKRKRADEVSSTSTILASAAQGNNTEINPAPTTSAHEGPATRRRKAAHGAAIPVAQSTQVHVARRRQTHHAPLSPLLKISKGFSCPAFETTHKRQCAEGWNSTPCLMCGVSRRRRQLNDTAHSHRSAKPNNKNRMPWCACMQAIGVHYSAVSRNGYQHTNMANFGLVLLHRYPQLVEDKFKHDQITGVAASDLKKWWAAREDLQKAHKEGRLLRALEDAARQVKTWNSLSQPKANRKSTRGTRA